MNADFEFRDCWKNSAALRGDAGVAIEPCALRLRETEWLLQERQRPEDNTELPNDIGGSNFSIRNFHRRGPALLPDSIASVF